MFSETVLAVVFGLAVLAALGFALHHRFLRRRIRPAPTATLREVIDQLAHDPRAFSPLLAPGMNVAQAVRTLRDMVGDMETVARRGEHHLRVPMDDLPTARLAAEILAHHDYRAAVLRTPTPVLRIAWDRFEG